MSSTELRIFIWNHERFRDEVEMFRTLGDLKTLQIFVHPVLPSEFITPREVIDSLMWQHGFECLRLGMRSCPHQIEIYIIGSDFVKTVGVENLTNNLGVRLNHFECEMIAGSGRVGGGLTEGERVEDNNGISPLLHGGAPGDIVSLVSGPGTSKAHPRLLSALASGLLLPVALLLGLHVGVPGLHYVGLDVAGAFPLLFKFSLVYSFQNLPGLLVLIVNPLQQSLNLRDIPVEFLLSVRLSFPFRQAQSAVTNSWKLSAIIFTLSFHRLFAALQTYF